MYKKIESCESLAPRTGGRGFALGKLKSTALVMEPAQQFSEFSLAKCDKEVVFSPRLAGWVI